MTFISLAIVSAGERDVQALPAFAGPFAPLRSRNLVTNPSRFQVARDKGVASVGVSDSQTRDAIEVRTIAREETHAILNRRGCDECIG